MTKAIIIEARMKKIKAEESRLEYKRLSDYEGLSLSCR